MDTRHRRASYEWTVTPSDDCGAMGYAKIGPVAIGKEVVHQGKTFDFTVLCAVRVSLKVQGPAGEDTDVGVVSVAPRHTKTDFSTSSLVEDFEVAKGGSNLCSVEALAGSSHMLHRGDDAYTQEYERKQVSDDGPFNGAFYVGAEKLMVKRTEYVNLDRLEAQARAHEAAHSALLKGYLDFVAGTSFDPSVALEGYAAMDQATLDLHAKTMLRAVMTSALARHRHFHRRRARAREVLLTSRQTAQGGANGAPPSTRACAPAFTHASAENGSLPST
jgi:hypothetical protein